MQEPNFIDPKTKEEFYFSTFRAIATSSGIVYKDKFNKEIVNPKTGTPLITIPKEGFPTAFWAPEAERLQKTQAHFKARAKKHAQSEEGRGIKQKVKDREMDNMGYDKVKKKK